MFFGFMGFIPMVLDLYSTTNDEVFFRQSIVLVVLAGFVFSAQSGSLEALLNKIIAVNTKKPRLQMIIFKAISSGTCAGFFFAGW
jgi:p-aminobenzoyl-glutamate transporter AbgT